MAASVTRHYPARQRYVTKKGEVRYSTNSVTLVYRYKLHHPDAAEMAVIRAELAAGLTKKSVAQKHRLGKDEQRLNRLLKKFPVGAPLSAPALVDADVDPVLAEAGWA